MLASVSVLSAGASCWAAAGLAHTAPLLFAAAAVRTRPALLQISESLDAGGGTTDTGSFFTAWDGRTDDGISPEGAVPLGEDLIEDDLRKLFSLETDDAMTDGTEMDDLAVRPSPRLCHISCAYTLSTRANSMCVRALALVTHSSCTSFARSWATPTFARYSRTLG